MTTTNQHRPGPPRLSATGVAVLAAAHRRDTALHTEAGACLAELRTAYHRMSPDEQAALLLDGFRWRHYWRPDATALRAEREQAARQRLTVDASHSIAALLGPVGPSHTELQRRRYPPDGDPDGWVAHGPPGHHNHPGTAHDSHDSHADRTVHGRGMAA